MQSKPHDVNEVVYPPTNGVSNDVGALEMCDNGNQYSNDVDNDGDGTGQTEGCNADVNQFMTSTGGAPNIAPDEFVVVGDDEDSNVDTNQRKGNITGGFGHEDVNEVIVGERNGTKH
eukprot:925686_1